MKKLQPFRKAKIASADNAQQFQKEMEIDVMARTLWGEARGEGSEGMKAVANVILNRLAVSQEKGKYWWGNSIIQICQKPYQFSCWNKDDRNYKKLLSIDETDLDYVTALRLARRAVYLNLEDITAGATHYHATGISPYWSKNTQPVAVIGAHIFYNLT